MDSEIFGPRIETEDLLLFITKRCETFDEQAHVTPQKTFEFRLTKPEDFFQINHLTFLDLTLKG